MPRLTKAELAEKLKKEAKRVRDRNYRFRKMMPTQQRVTIARDVLRLLEAEEIIAKSSTYMDLGRRIEDKDIWANSGYWTGTKAEGVELHQLIESAPTCQVCGIGACFVAAVRRADKCKSSDMSGPGDDDFMREYLGQWFDEGQIELIETAFEMDSSFYNQPRDRKNDVAFYAQEFGKGFKKDGDRLAAIFENVVKNDGKFVPPPCEGEDEAFWDEGYYNYDYED